MAAVGVDGCGRAWVAVALREGQQPTAYYLDTIAALAVFVPDASVIAIDIPIGLSDAGWRQTDIAARAALGRRRSSLFMTPPRSALEAPTHDVATARAKELTGTGVSQQAFGLRSKIFEVEAWLPEAPCAVYEAHPELSFTIMTGEPARATKKSWQGMIERLDALVSVDVELMHVDPAVGARVGVDDLIDAAAVAWTASRLLAGTAQRFGDPAELDTSGRPIAIWA